MCDFEEAGRLDGRLAVSPLFMVSCFSSRRKVVTFNCGTHWRSCLTQPSTQKSFQRDIISTCEL